MFGGVRQQMQCKFGKLSKGNLYKSALWHYAQIAVWTPEIYPDFLCIGAARAATTWLHRSLSHHPEIFLPRIKETHFFDEAPVQPFTECPGIQWERPFYFDLENPSDWRWYFLLYQGKERKLKGDITPAYMLLSRRRIRLIRERMPQLKILLILRNPIERAWSGARRTLWKELGRKTSVEALSRLQQIVFARPVLARGHYRECIENWETVFDRKQIAYFFFDDLRHNPRQYLQQVCNFLEVDMHKIADVDTLLDEKVNAAPSDDCPAAIFQDLARYYAEQIHFLEEKFERNLGHWLQSPHSGKHLA